MQGKLTSWRARTYIQADQPTIARVAPSAQVRPAQQNKVRNYGETHL
jgi:hypothetical protein